MHTPDDKPKTPANEPTSFVKLTAVGGDGIPHDVLTLGLTPVEGALTKEIADLSAVKSTLMAAYFYALTRDKLRAIRFDKSVEHLQEPLTDALKDALWIAAVITFTKAMSPGSETKKEWVKRHPEVVETYRWVCKDVRNRKIAHRGPESSPTANQVTAGLVLGEDGTPEGSMFADLPNPKLSHSPTDDEWRQVAALIRSALDFVSTKLEHEKASIEKKIWDEIPEG